jgi:hypothetical protein
MVGHLNSRQSGKAIYIFRLYKASLGPRPAVKPSVALFESMW